MVRVVRVVPQSNIRREVALARDLTRTIARECGGIRSQ
jgi:hypothetical protein